VSAPEEDDLRALVERALGGSRAALLALVEAVQHDVYNLAVRMLGRPSDAEDASQEILIKVVTKLAQFRGDSSVRTWVYRVAANHLLSARKEAWRRELSFDETAANLETARAASTAFEPAEQAALVDEVKLHCTSGMLLCLDRGQRLAFILGEILELPGEQAAAILEIEPAAFRQRLARARAALDGFLGAQCGLANPDNPCRCRRIAPVAVKGGLIDPAALGFAHHATRRAHELRGEIDRLMSAVELFRAHPDYAAPAKLVARLREDLARTN
jgi:RNA polymerase sigma factor (sigma-70 family)